ncbi:MAG: transposase [Planctomycetes bacterium]|nr:transposase [Planctomycetota bacterium]
MRALKSVSAVRVNRLLGRSGRPLWQRNYYDRIVRDENELNRIRQYIAENPARWDMDPENPARREPDASET